jgi:DNA polymerase I
MMRLLFDIEADGFLPECTRMWVMVAKDLDTGEEMIFEDADTSWMSLFDHATELAGHNIIGYDLMVLKKLYDYEVKKDVRITDTLILSKILDYKRFGNNGHGLAVVGEHYGVKKLEHEDWSRYSPEMRERCRVDVKINVLFYNDLMKEQSRLMRKAPQIATYIEAEHYATKWAADANWHGWPFNMEVARDLALHLESQIKKAENVLQDRLGIVAVPVDKKNGIVPEKMPKWIKSGFYDAFTARWFNVHPCSGYPGEERLVEGPFCRVIFRDLVLSSVKDVKVFLFRQGWQPTEWNWKRDPVTGQNKRTSPKITEDSLEFLGGDGKLYSEYLVDSSRLGVLKGWLTNAVLHEDGTYRVHGDCDVVGTPSMRARHQIIANIPKKDSKWGAEFRSLFTTLPGWTLVGSDSKGNQARGLAHYLQNEEFTHTLLHEDIHEYNAAKLTKALAELGIQKVVEREPSKRILYALLFGASGGKLWLYIFGVMDEENGGKLKTKFLKSIPNFYDLLDKLKKIYSATSKEGEGYIPSLAGNKLYVDSYHKLLVYLLQGAEKVTCSTALMYTAKALVARNIPYIPCIYYHDEIQYMVPDAFAQEAAKISSNAFKEGPKEYGVTIMDGDSKVGNNWLETH